MIQASDAPFLRLHANDNIAIAKKSVRTGDTFQLAPDDEEITVGQSVGLGHKLAIQPIAKGDPVYKFGQMIGYAQADIAVGDWVHSHNLAVGKLNLDYAFASATPPAPMPIEGRTFMGYRRANGKAATRNYIGLVSTVNCSATAAKYVAQALNNELLDEFPNVDGVLPLVHKGGCAMQFDGEDHAQLNRTLAGFAQHPNIGAYLVLGLGCETGQASFLAEQHDLVMLGGESSQPKKQKPLVMNIQDQGGIKKTVARAIAHLKELLPEANKVEREPIPVSELILATECGGSDGYSGVTANPAVGIASDLLVAHGATSILAETPEIYGGEHLLTRRAISADVGQKLVDRLHWWEQYTGQFGVQIDNNPSVGNKAGGLTTIYEKSLGAIAKGGSTALRAVYQYAEPVTEKGFVIMDTPGYDPASVTGMVAGGANLVVFTTGRGSCFGCKPVPTLKVATNSVMYNRMIDDMDINAGRIVDGGASVEEVGEEIFETLIRIASGETTKSEQQGVGDEEFCPWSIGPVL